MEQKREVIEQREIADQEFERLMGVVENADIEQFVKENEMGLMHRAEKTAHALIEQSNADPEKFLELLQEFDPELRVIRESKFIDALKELIPYIGGAYFEKKTIAFMREFFMILVEKLTSRDIKGLDDSMKDRVEKFLNSQKGAEYFIDKFQKGLDETEGVPIAICLSEKDNKSTRLIYHEGVHAIQDMVGFYPTKMEGASNLSEASDDYKRLKAITELQTSKLLVEEIKKKSIRLADDKAIKVGLLAELKYFELNTKEIKKYI